MLKIRMVRSEYGSYNGAHVMLYAEGKEFLVGEGFMPYNLAEVFLEIGAAEVVGGVEDEPGRPVTDEQIERIERAKEVGKQQKETKDEPLEPRKATESKYFGIEEAESFEEEEDEEEGGEETGKPHKSKKLKKGAKEPKYEHGKESKFPGLLKDEGGTERPDYYKTGSSTPSSQDPGSFTSNEDAHSSSAAKKSNTLREKAVRADDAGDDVDKK